MTYCVTYIPGDGIGPEVMDAAKKVLEATGIKFEWDTQEVGEIPMNTLGTPLPDQVINSIKNNNLALKGPVTTPIGSGFRSVNVAIRKALDLYANIRPCKTYKGVRSRYENIDLVIIRENTEDLYAGIEFNAGENNTLELVDIINNYGFKIQDGENASLSIKAISKFGSERIIKFGFDYAKEQKRQKVTAVTKANIMKFSDGLFLKIGNEIAKEYSDLTYEERLIDNLCMQLVTRPEEYDVLVLPNLYGDIVSDLAAGLVGGLGVAPGANIGKKIAVFEAIHGSAPKYTGQNKMNPTACILSGVLLLQHIGEFKAAAKVEKSISKIIEEGKYVTYDFKENRSDQSAVNTSEMANAIIKTMEEF